MREPSGSARARGTGWKSWRGRAGDKDGRRPDRRPGSATRGLRTCAGDSRCLGQARMRNGKIIGTAEPRVNSHNIHYAISAFKLCVPPAGLTPLLLRIGAGPGLRLAEKRDDDIAEQIEGLAVERHGSAIVIADLVAADTAIATT